jgi:hypothetical protein
VPKKPDPAPREYHVGDKLQVKLHDGRTVDASVRAIVDDGEKLQVDFGHEETALVSAKQVVEGAWG